MQYDCNSRTNPNIYNKCEWKFFQLQEKRIAIPQIRFTSSDPANINVFNELDWNTNVILCFDHIHKAWKEKMIISDYLSCIWILFLLLLFFWFFIVFFSKFLVLVIVEVVVKQFCFVLSLLVGEGKERQRKKEQLEKMVVTYQIYWKILIACTHGATRYLRKTLQ